MKKYIVYVLLVVSFSFINISVDKVLAIEEYSCHCDSSKGHENWCIGGASVTGDCPNPPYDSIGSGPGGIGNLVGSNKKEAEKECQNRCAKALASPVNTTPGYIPNIKPTTFSENLQYGSSGVGVKDLQQNLYDLGFMKTLPTGYFGSVTKGAVCAFQIEKKILTTSDPACGIFGPRTRDVLNKILSGEVLGVTYETLKQGMRGEGVLNVQKILIEQKYLLADSDTGYFGSATFKAVQDFQRAKGLLVDGIIGENTQDKLFPNN